VLLVQSHIVFTAVQTVLCVGKVVLQAFDIFGAFGDSGFVLGNLFVQLFGGGKRLGNGLVECGNVGRTAHHAGFEGGRTAGIRTAGVDDLTVERDDLVAEAVFARHERRIVEIVGHHSAAEKIGGNAVVFFVAGNERACNADVTAARRKRRLV